MKLNEINRLLELAGVEKLSPDDFQKVFFGDLKGSDEKDTDIESQIYHNLKRYVKAPGAAVKDRAMKSLEALKDLKGHFPDDLVPDTSVAYRGTAGTKEIYMKAVKIVKRSNMKEAITFKDVGHLRYKEKYVPVPNIMYQPKSGIQSWSKEFEEAEYFQSTQYPMILKTKVDNTFILSSKLTNMLRSPYPKEDEIIRVSSLPIECIAMIPSNELVMRSYLFDE